MNSKPFKLTIALLLSATSLCHADLKTYEDNQSQIHKDLNSFSKINLNGNFEVLVFQESNHRIELTGVRDAIAKTDISIKDKTLFISNEYDKKNKLPLKLKIFVKEPNDIELNGLTTFKINKLKLGVLKLKTRGKHWVDISGVSISYFELNSIGDISGNIINPNNLKTKITTMGEGQLILSSSPQVTGEMMGDFKLIYGGKQNTISLSTFGLARIFYKAIDE